MIYANKTLKSYILGQKDKGDLAEKWGVTKQTVYNILNDDSVSAETIAKILQDTGFEFEKAFELRD